ncbi:peptidoglycan DD-metalloendopeptidase family protein [Anaeromyxobacter paludicola]|uniref:M23ase beta-sheet core domain-containing protein n=1 Tax=Anaeromyxobacter paludicola TaxID=2918171 RepID=A0ABM7X829_9BACT|nr:peptidoglycan DD-metalloendopeptidase family protein [Anaeromyxobacter paludicola]BDG08009.1 hypothetical protein AMPC_11220 [Anaeromyxobacter paludicola]
MKLSAASAGASDAARLHDAAQALEAMMLKQIISSSGAFKGNGVAGSSIRADLFSDALAEAVAKAGGLGLAAELERSLGARAGSPSPSPSAARSPAAPSAAPARAGGVAAAARALPAARSPATVGAAAAASDAAVSLLAPDLDVPDDGDASDVTGATGPAGATPPAPSAAGPRELAATLVGPTRVTSPYGLRADPFTGVVRPHHGVDLAAAEGSTVQAALAGTVKRAGPRNGYGNTVEIESPDGVTTLYAHASELLVSAGARVEAGQPIARVGHTGRATGAHLHFEARQGGRAVDPSRFLKAYGIRDDGMAKRGLPPRSEP